MIQKAQENRAQGDSMPTMILFLLILLFPLHAFATPVTLEFAGDNGGSIAALGTFSYDTQAAPTMTNLGGLSNLVYTPTNWDFALTTSGSILPSQTFSSALLGQSAQLCIGICTFASGQQLRLNFRDGAGLLFHFSFGLTEPVTTPPTYNQIGGLGEAIYRVDGSVPLARLINGSLSQTAPLSVPEPSSWLLLTVGLGAMLLRWRME
jgi:hypothetical protein